MQKGYEGGISRSARFVQVSPKSLRTIADRLEALARVNSKESVTFELTPDITLYYDPGIDLSQVQPTAIPSTGSK